MFIHNQFINNQMLVGVIEDITIAYLSVLIFGITLSLAVRHFSIWYNKKIDRIIKISEEYSDLDD